MAEEAEEHGAQGPQTSPSARDGLHLICIYIYTSVVYIYIYIIYLFVCVFVCLSVCVSVCMYAFVYGEAQAPRHAFHGRV